ncbi:MAG: TIGR03617 family F420-dependent LLM class oxidoreductase [Anaerolineales bacterium]
MLLDAAVTPATLSQVPAMARAAEAAGLEAVWTTEIQHNPFLPLPLVAEHTARLRFGTGVAIGFARSPLTLAQASWDLAQQSGGRFMLGLGTQVRAHIERRFGMPWPQSPTGKLRELIGAIRAVWRAWQTGERLNYRGEYFKLTLMTPFFNPGPIEHPDIPIYIAGVNTGLARLAGETADGFHVHPFHTPAYLREVLRPAIEAGAQKAGRGVGDIQIAGSVFAITSAAEREPARQQIAFYASTPSYRPVLAQHGWEGTAEALAALAARGEWAAMPALISDEMLDTFAVSAALGKLAAPVRERYEGLLDRVALYRAFTAEEDQEAWRRLADGIRGG